MLLAAPWATACGSEASLFVPAPELPSEAASVFYAFVTEGDEPRVFASPSRADSVSFELDSSVESLSEIYAVPDVTSLEEHGLVPGLVPGTNDGSGRPLRADGVLFRPLGSDEASWSPSSLPRALADFRFDSAVPTRAA